MISISQWERFPGVNSEEFPGMEDFLTWEEIPGGKDFLSRMNSCCEGFPGG